MESDCFPRFKRSPEYIAMISELTEKQAKVAVVEEVEKRL